MATGIFCTNAEVLRKAGENASAVSSAVAYTDDYITQAESYINVMSGKNWSDDYAGLNADVKGILKEAASNLAAVYVIIFDMFSYTQLQEAETMINTLMARFDSCMVLLRNQVKVAFIDGET